MTRPQHLQVLSGDGYRSIRLSGNPLSLMEATELETAFREVADDAEQLGVICLASAGPDFCPGLANDLEPLLARCNPTEAIARCPLPVVVALRGRIASVGLEIALAGDLRIADATSRFALRDVFEGRLPSWGGSQRLVRVAGRGLAARMLLAGEEIDLPEALRCGLVHKGVVDSVDEAAEEWSRQLAASAPLALAAAKEALRRGPELPMRNALEMEGDLNHLLQTTSDRAEGLRAFFEKRPAVFEGS